MKRTPRYFLKASGIVIIIITLLLISLVACTTSTTTTEAKVLNVGAAWAMSGVGAPYGIISFRNADIVADMYNAEGGIDIGGQKYRINLILEDTQSTAEGAAAAAEKLITQDKVAFVCGGEYGITGMALAAVTNKHNTLLTHCVYAQDMVTPQYPYAFRCTPSPAEMIPVCYNVVHELWPDAKTIAQLALDDPSTYTTTLFLKNFAPYIGMELINVELYQSGTQDFKPLLTKVLAQNPDVLEVASSPAADVALMVKQAYELGYKGHIVDQSPYGSKELMEIAGPQAAEGFISHTFPTEGPEAPSRVVEFRKRYTEKYGWSDFAPFGDLLAGPFQAMIATGSTDAKIIAEWLESGNDFESILGPASFGQASLNGIAHQYLSTVFIVQVQNGEAVFVGSMSAEDQQALFNDIGWVYSELK